MTEETQTQNTTPSEEILSTPQGASSIHTHPFLKKEKALLALLSLFIVLVGSTVYMQYSFVGVEVQQPVPIATTSSPSSNQNQNPNTPLETKILTELEARAVAESSCVKGGEVLSAGMYNEYTRTWWFDANLNATQEGCNPACVVSEDTKTAEINWRCTGAVLPQEEEDPVMCTMDAKECPDGSFVGRVAPSCAFAPCPLEGSDTGVTVHVVLNEPLFLNEKEFMTPLEVVEDSRCPVDVECFWAGEVKLKVTLVGAKETVESVLTLNDSSVPFAGKNIQLTKVSPEPKASDSIEQSEYSFEFLVQ